MRVLVCGGRDLYASIVQAWLNLHAEQKLGGRPSFVIEGGADGADHGARLWRKDLGLDGQTYPADWRDMKVKPCVLRYRKDGSAYNAAAGAIRNQKMLDEGKPDIILALPGGPGTMNMKSLARSAGVKVIEIEGDFK